MADEPTIETGGVPLHHTLANSDSANPEKVIQQSKADSETFLNDFSTYASDDVSAFLYIRMYKYKRGRQTLNEANTGGITLDEIIAGSAVLGGLAGGIAVYNATDSLVPKKGFDKGRALKTAGGALAGAATGAAIAYAFTTERTRDKSDTIGTIILPLLNGVNMNYDTNWSEFTSPLNKALFDKAVGGIANAANNAFGSGQANSNNAPTDAQVQTEQNINNAADIVTSDYVGNVVANTLGATFNPDNELVLNGIGLRMHTFEFTLTPKNQKEKDSIKKAIKQLKLAMTPAKIGATENSALALSYPYEFSLFFMDGRDGYRGKQLDIPPIPDCALIDMSVTYNPMGMKFHYDASVVQYRITLTFKEHQTLTRDDLLEGGF